ncbi:MAG: tetraacyldisaccharide 4'-kinase [Gammaproteobacteria bacterium]|nr:tetraacyldisaccharide 4'-kinase [Gammaproteobacteria bacterium]MDH5591280.1 tetraacyldisaccharide 4'-kinase [Gammaproteobacteria bacterium]
MKWLISSWYHPHPVRWILSPLSGLYCLLIWVRQQLYCLGIFKQHQLSVPVIIVGNISVGGTGKTPFVIWLAKRLQQAGYRPGIVSRGYGGKAKQYPQQVTPHSDPKIVGDEPVIISRHTNCPMAVAPNRVSAGQMLLKHYDCDIIIADDGLQHYALGRDIEIAIVDGSRLFGNHYCLPAGPLREPISRLKKTDFIVHNGSQSSPEFNMTLSQRHAINLSDPTLAKELDYFKNKTVHAIAGIGNPTCFFKQLTDQGISITPHPFTDHHSFVAKDLYFNDDNPILMTEKDAVKCQQFANKNMWYIPIEATISGKLDQQLIDKLAGLTPNG